LPGYRSYIAPEILNCRQFGVAADWFSFGVLLWFLVTGGMAAVEEPQPPTKGMTLNLAEVHALIEVILENPGALAAPITGEVKDIVLKLVMEDPMGRLDGAGIRSHPYFASLDLCAPDADAATVRACIEFVNKSLGVRGCCCCMTITLP